MRQKWVQKKILLVTLVALVACGATVTVQTLLSDKQEQRQKALEKLSRLPDEKKITLIPGLLEALRSDDSRINDRAIDALKTMGPAAVPSLKGALQDPDVFVRLSALEILAADAANDPALIDGIIALLKDPHPLVRSEAAYYLGKMGPAAEKALPALKALAQKPKQSADVLSSANEAIARIAPPSAKKIKKKT